MAINPPPIKERLCLKILNFLKGNNAKKRHSPYPPNLSSKAAKIIDPTTGASTWALGNHKWKAKIGNFTKKPANKKNVSQEPACLGPLESVAQRPMCEQPRKFK